MSRRKPQDASRRDFIKTAAAAGAAAALGATTASADDAASTKAAPDQPIDEPTLELDVAVVGAGIAGSYAAYRLIHTGPDDLRPDSPLHAILGSGKNQKRRLSVGLFEYSGRVGGRLLSPTVEGIPSYTSEFGGFRFNHQMQIVWDTARHVGLTDEVFHFDEQPDEQQNKVYIRGTRLTQKIVQATPLSTYRDQIPYNLREDEWQYPAGLETLVLNRVFAGVLPDVASPKLPPAPNGYSALFDAFHAAFNAGRWSDVATFGDCWEKAKLITRVDGRELADWSWWALKRRFLSQEGVAFLEDSGGYNERGTTGNIGSNNVDESFYFPATTGELSIPCDTDDAADCTRWRHIVGGYARIPGKLAEDFQARGGGLFVNNQLVRFDKNADGGYDLLFYERTPGPGTVKTSIQGQALCDFDLATCQRVTAKYILLALPKRSLDLLAQDNFFFQDPTVSRLVQTAGDVPAIRMFMAYDEAWWNRAAGYRDPPVAVGRSTTDLGVRQFYYWQTEEDGKALLLATYSSAEAERYWQSLQVGQPYDDLQGAVSAASPIDQPQRGGPRHATATMAQAAHAQIAEVVGAEGPQPLPYYAHFQNWTKDPWGAGWHFFHTGQAQYFTISEIRRPMAGENVFIVGESYSNVQGWVQGAMNSSESVLQCELRLQWPSFVRQFGTWLGPGTRWLVPGGTDDPCVDPKAYIERVKICTLPGPSEPADDGDDAKA